MSNYQGQSFNAALISPERNSMIARGAGGHLIRLWYSILNPENGAGRGERMGGLRFENLLHDFINKSNSGSVPTKQVTRGNLRRELVGTNSITWRSFLRGLRVIRVCSFDMSCDLKWSTGKSTMHSIMVDLNQDDALSVQKQKKPTNIFVREDLDYRIRPKWLVIHSALDTLESRINKLWLKEKPMVTVNTIVGDLKTAMKNTTGSGGHLVRMFYQILSDCEMTTERFEYLLGSYVRTNKNAQPENSNTKQLSAGNLRRELIGGEAITWRSFIRGLSVLRAKELSVNLRLHYTDGSSAIHCLPINLRRSHIEDESELTPEDLS